MSMQSTFVPQPLLPLVLARPSYLMCQPRFYDVAYVINPWMKGNLHTTSSSHAATQWHRLYEALTEFADICLIDPKPGSPDMVFTANAGLERNGVVVLSNFFHPERRGEEPLFRHWFRSSGYVVFEIPSGISFEGEGDALFSPDGTRLWAGYGLRTSYASHVHLARAWGIDVVSLCLVDPRFYHLDTCFAPLSNGDVLYYPAAFDATSLAKIEVFYPPHKRIAVSESDAVRFACNAINIDRTVILNFISRELSQQLEAAGYRVISIDLDEFLKAGGAAKCLVMKLTPPSIVAKT
jgi:ornithine--oxo-acid transaminase